MANNIITAAHVASYYIEKSSALAENDLTNLKLQKMLYYTQAEYAAANSGDSLFADEIQAWQYGPVVPSIYSLLKSCGAYRVSDFDITIERPDFTEEIISFLDGVFDKYIRYSAWALVDATHKPGTPWYRVYANGAGDRQIIPQELVASVELLA